MNYLIFLQLFSIGFIIGAVYWEKKHFKFIRWQLSHHDKTIDLKNMNDRITSFSDKYSDLFSQLDNCRREIKALEAEIASLRVL